MMTQTEVIRAFDTLPKRQKLFVAKKYSYVWLMSFLKSLTVSYLILT